MDCTLKKNALFLPVLLLAAYLPFEDFLLKWLPVSDVVFLSLKQLPDITVLSLFLVIAADSVHTENRIYTISTKAFSFLSVFLFHAFFVIYLNKSSYLVAAMNIKALIRYIVLIYLFLYIKPTERQIYAFLKTVLIIAFIEVLIGAAQFLGGDAVQVFFKPFELSEETGISFTAMKHDELFGTMAHTINYAYYLLVTLVLILCFREFLLKSTVLRWTFALLLLAAIYLSGSRSAFLAAFIGILLYIHSTQGIKASASMVLGIFLVLVLAFFFVEKGSTNVDFWFFLSPDFLKALEAQRLGLVRIFISFMDDPHVLYGLSSDKDFVVNYISGNFSLPYFFAERTLKSIEDVYWIALTTYYGIIGLVLFVFFLFFLYKKLDILRTESLKTDLQERLFLASKILLLLNIPLNFVGQAFEARHYSYYFWALLGMTASQLCAESAPPVTSPARTGTAAAPGNAEAKGDDDVHAG
jgi:hypothetical protein